MMVFDKKIYDGVQNAKSITELEEFKVKSGFIYLLKDGRFPEYVKVGRTTDIPSRLNQYNAHKPINTCTMLCVSREFEDAKAVEAYIVKETAQVYSRANYKKEWFEYIAADDLVLAIIDAESLFK